MKTPQELNNDYYQDFERPTRSLNGQELEIFTMYDELIVSNVRQTKLGGASVGANPNGFLNGQVFPAGTPVLYDPESSSFYLATLCVYEAGSGTDPFLGFGKNTTGGSGSGIQPEEVVGVLIRSHDFSKDEFVGDGVAVCAHIDAQAYANAIHEFLDNEEYTANSYLVNDQNQYYPVRNWFNSPTLALTIENAFVEEQRNNDD